MDYEDFCIICKRHGFESRKCSEVHFQVLSALHAPLVDFWPTTSKARAHDAEQGAIAVVIKTTGDLLNIAAGALERTVGRKTEQSSASTARHPSAGAARATDDTEIVPVVLGEEVVT